MIFAAYFVMRGRNTHIDFLRLLPGGTDLSSSLRLSKGF